MDGLRLQITIQIGSKEGDDKRMKTWGKLAKKLGNADTMRLLVDEHNEKEEKENAGK